MSGHANLCQLCQKLPIVMSYDLHIKVLASSLFTLVSVSVVPVPVAGWGPLSKLMCNEPESDTIIMSAHGDKWGTRHPAAGAGHILASDIVSTLECFKRRLSIRRFVITEKAPTRAFSAITNLRMKLFEALCSTAVFRMAVFNTFINLHFFPVNGCQM